MLSSCLHLLSAGLAGTSHQAWLQLQSFSGFSVQSIFIDKKDLQIHTLKQPSKEAKDMRWGLNHTTVTLTFAGTLVPILLSTLSRLQTLFSFPELHADPRLTACHSASMTNLFLMPRYPKDCRRRDRGEGRDLGHQLKSYCVLYTARLHTWDVPAPYQPSLACCSFPSQYCPGSCPSN